MSDFDIYSVADPRSVAVPYQYVEPSGTYSYDESDPFGFNFLSGQQREFTANCLSSNHPIMEELADMRQDIENIGEQNAFIRVNYNEIRQHCLQTCESTIASFQERLDAMNQMNFNEIVWHSFVAILKHRSALDQRRFERQPIQKAARKTALQTQFRRFQARWKRLFAWADVASRLLPASRQSTRHGQLRRFQARWKGVFAWADAVYKLLLVSRQSSRQEQLRQFQARWKNVFDWADAAYKLLPVSRQSTRYRQLRRFQTKWKCLIAWADAASKLLLISRQSSRQGQLRRFQTTWKRVFAWADIASKILPISHRSKLQSELERLQLEWDRLDRWSNFAMLYSLNSSINSVTAGTIKSQWGLIRNEIKAYSGDTVAKWTRKMSKVTYASGSARVKKWKFIAFWSMLVNKASKEKYTTKRSLINWTTHIRKDLQEKAGKIQGTWSNMILSIGKERRNTRRLMVQLNHQDHIAAAIRNWIQLLKDQDLINTTIFNKVFLVQRWYYFYSSCTKKQKNAIKYHDEMACDMKRIFRIYCADFGHERGQNRDKFNSDFENTYGKWPMFWQILKESALLVYLNLKGELRIRLKKLHMGIFCLIKTCLRAKPYNEAFECKHTDLVYRENVQFMFDEIFHGIVQVDWDLLSLRFYILKATTTPSISFSMKMNSIANIVGFYYHNSGELMKLYITHVPQVMSKLAARDPPSKEIVNSILLRVTTNFKVRYRNRFEFVLSPDTSHGINVVIKCRMVRKVDGKVSSDGKKCECGLLEAFEQFHRAVFDNMVAEVLDLEKRMKIVHSYGRLLEHWDGSN